MRRAEGRRTLNIGTTARLALSFSLLAALLVVKPGIVSANAPPVFSQLVYELALAENRDGSGTPIPLGSVSATDADDGDTLTYSIDAGNAAGKFAIDGGTGRLTYVGTGEDHERKPGYSLRVKVDDGAGGKALVPVYIVVTNVNEPLTASDDIFTVKLLESTTIPASAMLANDWDTDGDALAVVELVQTPRYGTATISNDGSTVTYVNEIDPVVGNNAFPDSFEYKASDGNGLSATATVHLRVMPTEVFIIEGQGPEAVKKLRPFVFPNAVEDVVDVPYGGSVVINAADLLANDGEDGDDLEITDLYSALRPSHGTAVISPDRTTITYWHDGSDVPFDNIRYFFTYDHRYPDVFPSQTFEDAEARAGLWNVGTVLLKIAPRPEANANPEAYFDEVTVREGESVSIPARTLLANDHDPDGDVLTIAEVVSKVVQGIRRPAHGTATLSADGATVTYANTALPPGQSPRDSFEYRVTDGRGGTAVASVRVHVIPAADSAPAAADDEATVIPSGSVDIPASALLANDTDPNGGTLTVAGLVRAPAHGTATLSADRTTITYRHDGSSTRSDSFVYQVENSGGFTATAVVVVTVNRPPQAGDDELTAPHGETTTISVRDLLANDGDLDFDTLAVTGITIAPFLGTATLSADGTTITYVNNGQSGFGTSQDFFDYRVDDGHGGTDTALVTLNINRAPTAIDDEIELRDALGKTRTFFASALLGNDSDPDGDGLAVIGVAGATRYGTASLSPDSLSPDRSIITYVNTSQPGDLGNAIEFVDSLEYRISDGRGGFATANVNLTIRKFNSGRPNATDDTVSLPPGDSTLEISVADLLDNDFSIDGHDIRLTRLVDQPEHGSATLSTDKTTITYELTADRSTLTQDSFQYEIETRVTPPKKDTATVTVVFSGNRPPLGKNETYSVPWGGTLVIPALDLLANDWDADGDALTITRVSLDPTHGRANLAGDKSAITYHHNFATRGDGWDSFWYEVSDGKPGSIAFGARVNILIEDQGDPVAGVDRVTVSRGGTVAIPLLTMLANDNGSGLQVADLPTGSDHGPSHGRATLNEHYVEYTFDGTVQASGKETGDSFSYTVRDENGKESFGRVVVTLRSQGVNAPKFSDGVSATRSVAENSLGGVNVGARVAATDADDSRLFYALSGPDAPTSTSMTAQAR